MVDVGNWNFVQIRPPPRAASVAGGVKVPIIITSSSSPSSGSLAQDTKRPARPAQLAPELMRALRVAPVRKGDKTSYQVVLPEY